MSPCLASQPIFAEQHHGNRHAVSLAYPWALRNIEYDPRRYSLPILVQHRTVTHVCFVTIHVSTRFHQNRTSSILTSPDRVPTTNVR